MDEQRQWFRSRHGWEEQETPRILSFFAHAILQPETFVITDTTLEAADLIDRPEARPGSYACLAVKDNGHGIAADLRGRIFDPFFTTKDVGQGTGLGLATVHGIVKQHEGWIDVDSTPGSGAAFRVCFPAESEPEARDADDEDSGILPAPGFGATILAVEDEKALRAILKAALERHGYRVLSAANGPEALEVWAEQGADIDLLLTDLVMPQGMSGWELAQRLRAERADLKVLIMSGYAPSEQVLGGDSGAPGTDFGFLQKPYTLKGLARAVHDCLQT